MTAALGCLVVEHNNWCDADGDPYPPADDPAFWDAIPTELGLLLARLVLRDAPAAIAYDPLLVKRLQRQRASRRRRRSQHRLGPHPSGGS